MTSKAPAENEWQSIHTAPDSDDLLWFCRGDTFEGPRKHWFDDADYWDWWCYTKPPSLPTSSSFLAPDPEADAIAEARDWLWGQFHSEECLKDCAGPLAALLTRRDQSARDAGRKAGIEEAAKLCENRDLHGVAERIRALVKP